jgi:hypothetical protein
LASKSKPKKKLIHIELSNAECLAIFHALDTLNEEISDYEMFQLDVPGKIAACAGSAVAKLRNYDFAKEDDGVSESLPLTMNEFVAVHYALLREISSLKDSTDQDAASDLAILSVLDDKVQKFLEAYGFRFK